MTTKLPPALVAAQKQAAIERGDPLPVDLLPKQVMADALDEIELRSGLEKFKAQDNHMKTLEEALQQQPVYSDQDRLVVLRLAKLMGYIRGPKPKPAYTLRGNFTVHNTRRLWGTEHWNWLQQHVGTHTQRGTLPSCTNDMDTIYFWWNEIEDHEKRTEWAEALRSQIYDRYTGITVTWSVERQ